MGQKLHEVPSTRLLIAWGLEDWRQLQPFQCRNLEPGSCRFPAGHTRLSMQSYVEKVSANKNLLSVQNIDSSSIYSTSSGFCNSQVKCFLDDEASIILTVQAFRFPRRDLIQQQTRNPAVWNQMLALSQLLPCALWRKLVKW